MKALYRILLVAALLAAVGSTGHAQAMRAGFDAAALGPNDDGSTGLVNFGFAINFFGSVYNNAFLNNNGNISFPNPLSIYTPFPIVTTGIPMIAPFFADVDTRAGGLMRYGTGTVDGRSAFGVTWNGVCFFYQDCSLTNSFQVVLIDRSDIAAGDFDIEFNYNQIQWETGDASGGIGGLGGSCARAGFTNGITGYELPGSAVCGAFLDGGPFALTANSHNSSVDGRYVYEVRNGTPDVTVPEPVTMALLGTGLAGVFAARRRRREN